LGRPIKVETGYSSTTVSIVDTEYDSCACTPLGKVKRVSQPYAPGGTPNWTTYTYDALGRTVSVTHPTVNGQVSGTTTYLYEGNTVKVTDPAGKWKKMAQDALGNLTTVTEPRPGGGEYQTNYSYNLVNQLVTVSMPRDGNTQTRTFNYDPVTLRLSSTVNPESGTVGYEYNSDGTLLRKTDAKNQKVEYNYDSHKRVTQIRRYTSPSVEDVCQRTDLYYDSNPFDAGYSTNVAGRLAAKRSGGANCGGPGSTREFIEMYGYSQAGAATKKRLRVTLSRYVNGWITGTYDLDSSYGYDNEGKLTSLHYPDYWTDGVGQTTSATYTYTFDSMGRPIKLTDQSQVDVAWGVSYGIAGQLTGMIWGSSAWGPTVKGAPTTSGCS
jgi:YD repeat-containing protein